MSKICRTFAANFQSRAFSSRKICVSEIRKDYEQDEIHTTSNGH